MRFCGHCGSSLALRCPACGTESQPGFRFCGACGTGLGTAPAPDAAESGESTENTGSQEATPAPQAAERRQTTVLFCDLVDSTRLSDELDPEDLREVIRRYQAAAALIVDQYSGHIAQYLGDGLLIYFGYPTAQEDDAQRAVDAGLQILGAVGTLRTPTGEPLRARIGVHTGLGVAGEMGGGNAKREQSVVGKTPNVAARLQGLAEPNALVISSATHQLVAPYFVSRALGPQRLKGISEPVDALVVERHSEVRARFEGAMLRGLTPLVGREAELAILTDRYRRAVAGRGQTVLLAAEAGVGKSRMLHATLGAANADTTRLTAHCAPNAQTSSLMPVVELLRQLVGIIRTDRPAEALQKLRECLVRQHTPDAEGLALLAGFLSLPLPSGVAAPVLSAQKLRERTLRLLRRMLVAEAQTKSVIVVFEDLHWVDPSTLEFVEQLMDEGSKSSLLLLLTARPAFRAPWSFRPYEKGTAERGSRRASAAAVGWRWCPTRTKSGSPKSCRSRPNAWLIADALRPRRCPAVVTERSSRSTPKVTRRFRSRCANSIRFNPSSIRMHWIVARAGAIGRVLAQEPNGGSDEYPIFFSSSLDRGPGLYRQRQREQPQRECARRQRPQRADRRRHCRPVGQRRLRGLRQRAGGQKLPHPRLHPHREHLAPGAGAVWGRRLYLPAVQRGH